jgi:hypothetical protein
MLPFADSSASSLLADTRFSTVAVLGAVLAVTCMVSMVVRAPSLAASWRT